LKPPQYFVWRVAHRSAHLPSQFGGNFKGISFHHFHHALDYCSTLGYRRGAPDFLRVGSPFQNGLDLGRSRQFAAGKGRSINGGDNMLQSHLATL